MPWKKNSPEAVERFDELVAVPGARRSVMLTSTGSRAIPHFGQDPGPFCLTSGCIGQV